MRSTRSRLRRRPTSIAGIRAQEALLTLIENEAVPFRLPDWAGGQRVTVDSSELLFVCAGAFEGLYDSVFHRVTAGQDKGVLKRSRLWKKGVCARSCSSPCVTGCAARTSSTTASRPSFSRVFDAVVMLEPLAEEHLLRIFLQGADSALRQSQAYFASQGSSSS